MGGFIALWFAQIVFGAIVYVTNPRRDVSAKAESARKLAIYGGLVPCVGLMLIMQIIWLIVYRIQVARDDALHRRYQATLETSFGAPRSNAGELPGGTPNRSQIDNPFM